MFNGMRVPTGEQLSLRETRTRSARQVRIGITIVEALVIAVIVLILVGMLLPVVRFGSNGPSNRTNDGNNLKQILGAMIAYGQEQETAWPLGVPLSSFPARDAHQARLITARSFEVLAAMQTLPNALFHAARSKIPGPTLKARVSPINGDAWGASPANAVSYAFDWASPGEPASVRIILASRSPADNAGVGAMAAFGDGHSKWIKVGSGAGSGMMTEGGDGKPVTAVINGGDEFEPPVKDNIYDDNGDRGLDEKGKPYDPLSLGGAAPGRTWVK